MYRKAIWLIAVVALHGTLGTADGGTISGTIRNLDGTPILDQGNRTLSFAVTTANGAVFRATRLADGRVLSNDPQVTLTTDKPDNNVPDKITFRLTLNNALFANLNDKAVTLQIALGGRDNPQPINDLIGIGDTVLHLAFPELGQRLRYYCIPPCYMPQHYQSGCRWR